MIYGPEKHFPESPLPAPFQSGIEQRLSRAASLILGVDQEEPQLGAIGARFLTKDRNGTDQDFTDTGRENDIAVRIVMLDEITEVAGRHDFRMPPRRPRPRRNSGRVTRPHG